MAQPKKHIVVLGAGVIGLQNAVTLLEAGYAVTVVAEHWPDQAASMKNASWASPWAGAQWRAHASGETEAASWEQRTYAIWKEQVAIEAGAGHAPGQGPSSLASLSFSHYWHTNTAPATKPPWWASISPSTFTVLAASELPEGMAYGVRMQSFTLEPPRYLTHLLDRVRESGGDIVRTRIETAPASRDSVGAAHTHPCAELLEAIHSVLPASSLPVSALVNCTGLAAGFLVGDSSMVPNRGQTILVRGEVDEMRTRVGADPLDVLAVIPRPGTGTTVIGSTRGPGRTDVEADGREKEWLLSEGKKLVPELSTGVEEDGNYGFDVVSVNVGLRPRREGGARVEKEDRSVNGTVIVHAYGHEGAGYQQSVGTAEKVLTLLKKMDRVVL